MSEILDQLKEEARELGIDFSANIGEKKLQEKIDAFYESQETSGKEIEAAVKAKETAEEKSEEKSVVKSKHPTTAERARRVFEEASKTRIVRIIDNDQRVNNQTTTCQANWTNQYHDLGTKIFPLNEPIEIPQGFISVLKEVMIPMHTKDPKSGLARTSMRPRYTISYEDVEQN